ncbi:MAG: MFS transporter [archaeon]|nr:MFS transporter [archaeon]
MVKFGKKLRARIIEVWKDSYMDYKKLKQLIRKIYNALYPPKGKGGNTIDIESVDFLEQMPPPNQRPKSNTDDLNEDSFLLNEDIQFVIEKNKRGKYLKEFLTLLDTEFHKVYVNFVQLEKELYGQINRILYAQPNYNQLNIKEIGEELESLHCTIFLANSLKDFINDNVTALRKILKKFDKKFHKFFGYISYSIFSKKLNTQNSDLEYMLQFKVIDEANIIIEDVMEYIILILNSKKNKGEITNSKFDEYVEQTENIKSYIVLSDHHIDYQVKNKDWFYYIREGEKIVKNNPDSLKNDIYNPLLSSNISQDELLGKLLGSRAKRKLSKVDLKISLVNKINVILCLIHSLFSTSLHTVIIPSAHIYLKKINYEQLFVVVWALVPLFSLFSIFIFHQFKDVNYKLSFLMSNFFFVIGNALYCVKVDEGQTQLILIFVARALIGLGINPLNAKRYITQFVSKNYLPKVSLLYFFFSSSGYALGAIIGYLINLLPEYETELFGFIVINKDTYIGWFCYLASCILIIAFTLLFTISDPKRLDILKDSKAVDLSYNKTENLRTIQSGNCPLLSKQEKAIIVDLDTKLEELNQKNNFSDMNKIPQYIQKNINKERTTFGYLKLVLCITLLVFIICKVFSEFIIVFIAERIYNEKDGEQKPNTLYFVLLISGLLLVSIVSSFAGLIIQMRRHTRRLLLITLVACCLSLSTFIFLIINKFEIACLIVYFIFLTASTFCEIVTSNIVSNIMPPEWVICGLDYGVWIGHGTILGKVIGCAYFYFYLQLDHSISYQFKNYMRVIILSIGPFSFLALIISVIYNYTNLRVKAIARVIRSRQVNKI